MQKRLARPLALLTFSSTLLAATTALASDPQISTERRNLKPGPGTYVVDTTIELRVGEGQMKDPAGGTRGSGGWQPSSLKFDLWGKSDPSNAIIVNWKDGATLLGSTTCSNPPAIVDEFIAREKEWRDQGQVQCPVKDGAFNVSKPGTFDAEIVLKEAGKPDQTLRKLNFTVRSHASDTGPNATPVFYVDQDFKLAENVAWWDWDARGLRLRTYTKQADELENGKLKCTVDGKPLAEVGDVNVNGHFEYTDPKTEKSVRWIQLTGEIDRQRNVVQGMQPVIWKPGKYECQMIIKAKIFRTFRFALDAKLAIVTSPEQAGKPGAFVSNTTYIPDVDIPAGIDLPFNKTALEKQASYGRPWLVGAPKLGAGVGGTFVEPANFVPPPKAAAKPKKKK